MIPIFLNGLKFDKLSKLKKTETDIISLAGLGNTWLDAYPSDDFPEAITTIQSGNGAYSLQSGGARIFVKIYLF